MDKAGRPDSGGVPKLTFGEMLVLDLRPNAEFSGIEVEAVPIETLALFTRLMDDLPKRLDAGEPIESIDQAATGAFERAERQYPGRHVWNKHRLTLAANLLARNHVRQGANLIMQTGDAAYVGRTAARTCNHLAGYGRPSAHPSPGEFYSQMLALVSDNQGADAAIAFLRSLRNHAIDVNVNLLGEPDLDIERQLAARIPGYNAAQDWADTERQEYPQARCDELATLLANEALWPALSLHSRELITHLVAQQQNIFASQPSITREQWLAMQDALDVMHGAKSDLLIWDYLRASLAASLFEHNHMRRGLIMTAMITRPRIQAELVQTLLQEQRFNAARRVLMGLHDTDILISTLLSSLWPRADAKALLSELLDLPKCKGTISKHPLDLRVRCMQSMVDLYEQRGRVAEANELRRQIGVLRSMFARGYVRYVKPRR